jgi:hypothetical protein
MAGGICSDWVETDGDGVPAMGQWVEGNDLVKQIFPIENRMLKNVHSIVTHNSSPPFSSRGSLWLFITRILTRSKTV